MTSNQNGLADYDVAPNGKPIATVYGARDTRLNRTVAIKVFNDQFSQRVQREAQAVAAIMKRAAPSIAEVAPNGSISDLPTIRSELCRKTSFRANDSGE